MNVPITYLHECFSYREDGALIWKTRPIEHFNGNARSCTNWNRKNAGRRAGSINGWVRRVITVRYAGQTNKTHASRVIWAMFNGRWPNQLIDHRDRNTLNDRIENLREATRGQNSMNRAPSSGGLFSGVKKEGKYFVARVKRNYAYVFVEKFQNKDEAIIACAAAREKFHGEFAAK